MAKLVLATSSTIRQQILSDAGVSFEVIAARIDESSIKDALLADAQPPRNIADALAELKAQKVAMRHPDSLILAMDQVLVADGELFDKPNQRAEAKTQLQSLSGTSHHLISAAVAYENNAPVWRSVKTAKLTMRPLSDAFLDQYLEHEGDAILNCVGAYRLEGLGAQLFTSIEGDYFTILGLPLLEILAFLRTRGHLVS